MSVLVKGMKMPESCVTCPLNSDEEDSTGIYCNVLEIWAFLRDLHNGVLENCPLVEVPTPHGDLIDRGVARDNLMYEMVGTGYQSKAMKVCDEFYTPTVIEAEE